MNLFKSLFDTVVSGSLAQLDPTNDRYYTGQGAWAPISTAAGQPITPEQAMRESTAFACVRLLSDTIAMMDAVLQKLQKDGDKEPDLKNPLFQVLLFAANNRQTAFEYKKFNMMSLLLRGYWLSKIYRRSGSSEIISLEPCHPDYTLFGLRSDGQLYWSTVLCKDVAANRINKRFELDFDDAFYCPYASLDGIFPISPIAYNAETLGAAKEMREHGSTLFKNKAMPSGVLSTDKILRKDGRKRVRDSWQDAYGGGNRGKIAILEQGTDFRPITMSNEDAQYLETRQYTKEDICGFFGVPTHLVSDTKRAKGWSTTEQQMMEYLKFSGSPYLKRIEDAMRFCLLPKNQWMKKDIELNTSELLRADVETRTKQQEMHLKYGVKNPNEVRHEEGLNSRDGGDEYVTLPTANDDTKTDTDEEDNKKKKVEEEDNDEEE